MELKKEGEMRDVMTKFRKAEGGDEIKIRRRRYGIVVEDDTHMIFYLVEVEEG